MLTRKTFSTEDASGCEFAVDAYYDTEREWSTEKEKSEKKTTAIYKAFGLESNSLPELKKMVANM